MGGEHPAYRQHLPEPRAASTKESDTKLTRVAHVAARVRAGIESGEFPAGARLPSEAELGAACGVSRATVRAALRELDVRGLVTTHHGVGTFVIERPVVHASLGTLDSITDSIRSMGKVPRTDYASRIERPLSPEEAVTMALPAETTALELRRIICADGEVVAYSYDLLPRSVLPDDLDVDAIEGSLFAHLRGALAIEPRFSVAEIHAVHSEHIAWGPEAAAHSLFVLLNQRHFDADGRLILYSRTYFIEGRYAFTIARERA